MMPSSSSLIPVCTLICYYLYSFSNNIKLLASGFTIDNKTWIYKGYNIAYEEVRHLQEPSDRTSTNPKDYFNDPILLLNGFGVGSFHQHRLMPHLLSCRDHENDMDESYISTTKNIHKSSSSSSSTKHSDHRIVYGIDYLGQGKSWPIDCDDGNSMNERGLIYSIDTWSDQIIDFIQDVVIPSHQQRQQQLINATTTSSSSTSSRSNDDIKIHLVGNSVGGLLSVILATRRPDLFESICLLNPTPIWGLNLPGWSGHLPPPAIPRIIGRFLFDVIRDLNTIDKYLEAAYANSDAYDEDLMTKIRGCTLGKGGHAAFASIMWSPPATLSNNGEKTNFYNVLSNLQCDTLLIFGTEDTWCKPSFGKQMFNSLRQRGSSYAHRLIELDNVGHCPNHEGPQAIGHIMKRWASQSSRDKRQLVRLLDNDDQGRQVFYEPWADIVAREIKEEDSVLNFMDDITTKMLG